MARAVIDESGFIVGGNLTDKITPDFRLKEFASRGGSLRIHRELVSSLQMLRSAYGAPIRIVGQSPRGRLGQGKSGLFAWVRGDDNRRLLAEATALVKSGSLEQVKERERALYLEIFRPGEFPAVPARPAFGYALTVTATYETGGLRPFETVTGNFDGAGMSFGPIQSNFKSGTLQELFREFRAQDERRLRACFEDDGDYDEWLGVLERSRSKQIAWADERSIGSRKAGIRQPWRGHLQRVGRESKFQQIMIEQAYRRYGTAMVKAVNWLWGVTSIRVRNFACLASLFDLCVQQGSLDKAQSQIRRRIEEDPPRDEFDLVRIAVTERGKRANARWRADCISRRLGILERRPVKVTESGSSATRSNLNVYLIRDTRVRGLESYLVANRGKPGVG